jgi:hypothetical protein
MGIFAAENAMARVIAENYLRLVVLCVPVIVPPK